jgi:hypothetical protein
MRGKIAWLKSSVRHRTLAPFGGITRIRFKGSSNWTSQPSRLPRIAEAKCKFAIRKKNLSDPPSSRDCETTAWQARLRQPAFVPPSRDYGESRGYSETVREQAARQASDK